MGRTNGSAWVIIITMLIQENKLGTFLKLWVVIKYQLGLKYTIQKHFVLLFNNFTQECVWEEPPDYVEPTKKALAGHLAMSDELKAALKIQGAYRAKQARRVERAKRAAQHAAEQVPKDGWVEQMDPHTGEYYYYNVDTGEQTWDIPEALGGDKVPTWVKVYDPASISYYYFNNFTQECLGRAFGLRGTDKKGIGRTPCHEQRVESSIMYSKCI